MPEITYTQSLAYSAYDAIREEIIYCRLTPGQKLSMRALQKRLGVGRTPIRESLVRLGEQGLVYAVPQSGTYVSRINLRMAENARFMREHLERSIIIECCARIDDVSCLMLEELIAKQESAVVARDALNFFKLDNSFHETLFFIAGKHDIWKIIELSNTHLERFRWLRTQVAELDWEDIMDQHRHMLAAIKAGNTEEAGFLSSAHLHLMITEQNAVVNAFPDYFDTIDE